MGPDAVAFVSHSQYESGMCGGLAPDAEECRLHSLQSQRVENQWCEVSVGAIVECERNRTTVATEVMMCARKAR